MVTRFAVLVSGSGSNLQAILDAWKAGRIAGEPVVVISNRPGVKALERANAAGVDAVVIDHKAYDSRAAFEEALHANLVEHDVGLVVLAGFMRLLGADFVRRWKGRLVNIHPSLLPAFPGAHGIRDALAARASRTGVTIHFVDEGTDTGPIIVQEAVEIRRDDTEESLAGRVHSVEHALYPKVVDALCAGRVRLEDDRVVGAL